MPFDVVAVRHISAGADAAWSDITNRVLPRVIQGPDGWHIEAQVDAQRKVSLRNGQSRQVMELQVSDNGTFHCRISDQAAYGLLFRKKAQKSVDSIVAGVEASTG